MPTIGEIKTGSELGKRYHDKLIYHACVDCGKERWVTLRRGKPNNERCLQCVCKAPEFRSNLSVKAKRRIGEKASNWRGGKSYIDGYIYVYVSPDDFFHPMVESRNRVREHRLVMAKFLHRCLLPWEIVHHRNGNKADNRLENLELLSSARHNGISKLTRYIKALENRVKELEQSLLEATKMNLL